MHGGEDNLDVARLQLPDRPVPAVNAQTAAPTLASPPSFSQTSNAGGAAAGTGGPAVVARSTGVSPVGGAAANAMDDQDAPPLLEPGMGVDEMKTGGTPALRNTGEAPVPRAQTGGTAGLRNAGGTPALRNAGETPDVRAAQAGPAPLSVTQSVQEVRRTAGGGWTFPFLCAGIALVACCVLFPQLEENRRLMYECGKLKLDLAQLKEQSARNEEYIRRLPEDRSLAERLANKQLGLVRQDAGVLDLKGQPLRDDLCPLSLAAVPPPAQLPEYQPMSGRLASLCRNKRSQVHLMGVGLMLIAFGLVLGYHPRRRGGPSL